MAKYSDALLSVSDSQFSWRNTKQFIRASRFSFFLAVLKGSVRVFMVSVIQAEKFGPTPSWSPSTVSYCSSTQLLWKVILAANLQNTFSSRWATSHKLFEEHALLQSGKTICRRKLSFFTLLVFELSPSTVSLPGPFVLRQLLFTATGRPLLGHSNTLWDET